MIESVETRVEKHPEYKAELHADAPDYTYVVERALHLKALAEQEFTSVLESYADNVSAWLQSRTTEPRGATRYQRQISLLREVVESQKRYGKPTIQADMFEEHGRLQGVALFFAPPEQASKRASNLPSDAVIRVTHAGHVLIHTENGWQRHEHMLTIQSPFGQPVTIVDHRRGVVHNLIQPTVAENKGNTLYSQESNNELLLSYVLKRMGLGKRNPYVKVSSVLGSLQPARRDHLQKSIANRIPEAARASLYQRPDGAIRIAFGRDATDTASSVYVAANGRICSVNDVGDLEPIYAKRDADYVIQTALAHAGR